MQMAREISGPMLLLQHSEGVLIMRGTDIIYYTFEADSHCIECTQERFGPASSDTVTPAHGYGYIETLSDGSTIELDENHVRLESFDDEGNPIHPAFASDEGPDYASTLCGTCSQVMCMSCGHTHGKDYIVTTAMGERHWDADNEAHARDQHIDALPEEPILSIRRHYAAPEACWNCHTSFVDEPEEIPCGVCGEEKYEDDAFCGGDHCDNESFMRSYGTFHEHSKDEVCEACIILANAEARIG